jgi:hypothetical protein
MNWHLHTHKSLILATFRSDAARHLILLEMRAAAIANSKISIASC